jgi:AICAR transformylase/IMP cyclohydrolase PurH
LRALLSVSDREGIIELARALQEADIEVGATRETHAHLAEAGIEVTLVPDLGGAEPADIVVLDPGADDLAGIGLLRAAAANHQSVAAVSSPTQYASVLRDIKRDQAVSAATRQ